MAVVLTLGPIVFTDFQVPDRLPFGGSHQLVVTKFVGGDRDIQAMGKDDRDLTWTGRLRGPNAESLAQQINFIRNQGQQQVLTWSSFRYLVIVSSFLPEYLQFNEITYSITCAVIQDLTQPVPPVAPDMDSAIFGDLNDSQGLASSIDIPAVVSAVASVASVSNAVAKFAGATPSQVAGVQSSIQTALGVVNSQQTALNGTVASSGNVAGMVAGLQPQALAAALRGQSTAFNQLGQLSNLQALLGRASVNISNASF